MNKNQGFAAGLVVAATLMLRSVAPSSAPDAPPSAAASDANAPQAPTETRDGPWIASCNYWAPVRPASPPPRRDPEISGTIDSRPVDLHLNLPDSGKQERGCVVKNDTGKWGFPDDFSQIQVTALIAVVPDPVHTHLGLTFDRTMDALLQAGSDNGYPPSYFWLPWKSRGSVLKTAESPSDAEPGHDPDRERQPGLIILKSAHNFNEVIYLFVVGETVTEGVDGTQLQNAFQYESELQSALKGHFTTGKSGSGKSRVSIVGPTLSGSAASLRAAIDSAARISELKADEFHIAGS